MKLSTLIPTLATALGVPQPSVNVLAMSLRKEGLISRGGRGRGGAEMTPTDVTNLLLAAMSGGQAKDAHVVVQRLREASLIRSTGTPEGALPTVMDLPFLAGPHTLGQALDAIFLAYAADGELLEEEHQFPITNMRLSVESPHLVCYRAELWIDTGSKDWTLGYHRNHPAFEGAAGEQRNEIARSLLGGKGDLTFTARITSRTFYDLAEALEESAREQAANQLRSVLRRRNRT